MILSFVFSTLFSSFPVTHQILSFFLNSRIKTMNIFSERISNLIQNIFS